MPTIEFRNVSKSYGKIKAVINLNITIKDGEYISLLGPSGCGKTTTLRLLSGLIQPTEGEILWDGRPIQNLTPDERDIGYVFQQFAIFPNMNLWENVAYPLEVKGLPEEEIEETVEKYLELVGLVDRAHLFPHDVGAADLQRVGIARVLAKGAKVLLLDEPFGALDFKIREKFQDELRGIVKRLNLTAIHVTHDQSEGMAISDRIGVMKKGRMIQLASPMELLFRPSQIFSAHFIGESNFIEGVVYKKLDDSIVVEVIGGFKITCSSNVRSFLVGDRVVVGFRKTFSRIVEGDGENAIRGEVVTDRYLGEKRRILVNLQYGMRIELIVLPHIRRFSRGEEITISLDPSVLLVYNYPREGLDEALEVT